VHLQRALALLSGSPGCACAEGTTAGPHAGLPAEQRAALDAVMALARRSLLPFDPAV